MSAARPRLHVALISRLTIHGKSLYESLGGIARVYWIGRSLPYKMDPFKAPFLLLVEFLQLIRTKHAIPHSAKLVVLVHYASLDFIAAEMFHRLTGSKVFVYAIGSDIQGNVLPLQSSFLRWVVRRAKCVFCVSREVEARARELGARQTILLPTPFVPFKPRTNTEKEYDIVSVGALSELKNHELLIRACALMPAPTTVAIVGEGPRRERLASVASDLKMARVHLLGRLTREETLSVMWRSRVYVQCSVREGIPAAILEAIWSELPVVAIRSEYVADLTELYGLELLVADEATPASLAEQIRYSQENHVALLDSIRDNRSALDAYVEKWSNIASKALTS